MKLKKLIAPILLCLLTVLSLSGIILTVINADSRLSDVTVLNCDYSKGEKLMTIGDIEKLEKRISELISGQSSLSFCAEAESERIKKQTVTPVLTNELYFPQRKINIDKFDESSAVISRSLSQKLFKTDSAVGKQIKLCGNNYTVAAVYDSRDGLIDHYFDDGKERVFIPYKSVKSYEKYEVTDLGYENNTQSAATLEQMQPVNYYSLNLNEKSLVLRDFLKIAALIVYLTALVVALKLWKYLCRKEISKIKDTLEDVYALKSIRKNPKAYALLALFGLGIPLALIAVFILGDFGIYIIPRYIPYDNIFDIGYYLGEHAKAVQTLNGCALGGDKFLLNLYNGSFNSLIFETIIFAISLITTVVYFYKKVCEKLNK